MSRTILSCLTMLALVSCGFPTAQDTNVEESPRLASITEPEDAGNSSLDGSTDASLPADASNTGPNCPTPCNDSNPCTDDVCDPVRGCIYVPNTASCDDGNPCTVNDTCSAGACYGGGANSCDDSNSCTADTCVEGVGCQHLPINEGNSCNDYGRVCSSGACTCSSGSIELCGDGIDNNCDGKVDCADPMCNLRDCDDGNGCTIGDTCTSGQCVGNPRVCDYTREAGHLDPIPECLQRNGTCLPSVGHCDYSRPNNLSCTPEAVNECVTGGSCQQGSCVANTLPMGTVVSVSFTTHKTPNSAVCTVNGPQDCGEASEPTCVYYTGFKNDYCLTGNRVAITRRNSNYLEYSCWAETAIAQMIQWYGFCRYAPNQNCTLEQLNQPGSIVIVDITTVPQCVDCM